MTGTANEDPSGGNPKSSVAAGRIQEWLRGNGWWLRIAGMFVCLGVFLSFSDRIIEDVPIYIRLPLLMLVIIVLMCLTLAPPPEQPVNNTAMEPRPIILILPFLGLLTSAIGISLAYWAAQQAKFGDVFSPITLIFSTIAYAAIISTLWFQRAELQRQREELANIRAQLARSATAQEHLQAAVANQAEFMQQYAEAARSQAGTMAQLVQATQRSADRFL